MKTKLKLYHQSATENSIVKVLDEQLINEPILDVEVYLNFE